MPYSDQEALKNALRVVDAYAMFHGCKSVDEAKAFKLTETGAVVEQVVTSITDSQTCIYGFIGRSADGSAHLAFRGTSTPTEWLLDASFVLVNNSPGRTEMGFTSLYLSAAGHGEKQTGIVSACRIAGVSTLTGHSLGGAVVTLLARELKPDATYTFGGPAVGDAAFAASFDATVYRVVNAYDLVPRLPPGYVHVGELHEQSAPCNPIDVACNHVIATYVAALKSKT